MKTSAASRKSESHFIRNFARQSLSDAVCVPAWRHLVDFIVFADPSARETAQPSGGVELASNQAVRHAGYPIWIVRREQLSARMARLQAVVLSQVQAAGIAVRVWDGTQLVPWTPQAEPRGRRLSLAGQVRRDLAAGSSLQTVAQQYRLSQPAVLAIAGKLPAQQAERKRRERRGN